MREMQEIWPINGADKIIKLPEPVARRIRATMELMPQGTDCDLTWELVRVALEADREAREKQERRARGDFGPELHDATGVAEEISARTDGEAYEPIATILDRLDDIKRRGFEDIDVTNLLELHAELVEEVHHTDELVVKLGGLLLELKG